jgi:cytochrome P450
VTPTAAPEAPHPAATLRRIADLPGPKGWPVLGNAPQVRPATVHQTVEAWAREFGTLFRMRMGGRDVLVVADHQLLAAILKDRPDGFRRNPLSSEISMEMGLTPGLFSAEGEDWQRQRRMVMASFSPAHVRAYFPTLVRVAQRLQNRWRMSAQSGQSVVLQADLMRFTVDVISGLAFGRDINTLEAGDDIIQQHLDKVLPTVFKRIFTPIKHWRYLRTAAVREMEHSVAAINATIAQFVAEARANLREHPERQAKPANLLEAMIVAADAPGSGLGDRQIQGNVLTMLLAGEDTTANTLAGMIDLLWRHPDTLQKLKLSVGSQCGDLASWTMENLDAIDYLDACINETMRLKPVAPFIPVVALKDTQVADVACPKGTMVWGVLRHSSVSDRLLPRAAEFVPERWLPGSDLALTPEAKRSMMPFGSGPRMCPGRYLALLEMKMAMVALLTAFDIEAVETPDGQPAQERMAFTMTPVGLGLRLRVLG